MQQKDQDLYAWQLSAEILKQLNIHVGTITQFHQTQAEKTSYISNLKALQYDMLYGKQYVYGGEQMCSVRETGGMCGAKTLRPTAKLPSMVLS